MALFNEIVSGLQTLEARGILDASTAQLIMQKAEREYYLSMHKYAITNSTTGYFMTYLPTDDGGRIKKRAKTKEALEDIIIAYWRDQSTKTVSHLIMQWIDQKLEIGKKRNRFKHQTYERYMTDYHRFFDDTDFKDRSVNTLTRNDLEAFIIDRIETLDLTAKAYSGLRTILRGSLNYYAKENELSFSPDIFFKSLDLRPYFADRKNKSQVFSDSEIDLIKTYIDTHDESPISYGILLGFYSGLRIGEIAALKWSDICDGFIYVHRTEERYRDENGEYCFRVRDTPKTSAGIRRVVLTRQASDILTRMRVINPEGEYVFMNGDHRIKAESYSHKLVRICRYVGIEPRSMHKARKTYASALFKNRVDEALIIDQMGHTDIETTKQFYRFNTADDAESRRVIFEAINY